MLCSASFKTGNECNFKAKFAINYENKTHFVCGRHLLQEAIKIFQYEIKTIEDIPGVTDMKRMKTESTIP